MKRGGAEMNEEREREMERSSLSFDISPININHYIQSYNYANKANLNKTVVFVVYTSASLYVLLDRQVITSPLMIRSLSLSFLSLSLNLLSLCCCLVMAGFLKGSVRQ